MRVLVHQIRVLTIFLGLLAKFIVSETSPVTYNEIFKNLGFTFPGDYTSYADTGIIRCAAICKLINCAGFARDQATRECRIYGSLYIYTLPAQTTVTTLKTYLPEDSPLIFIKVIPGGRTWNSAKVECENVGGIMIYVPPALATEGTRLYNSYGAYNVGLYKTSATTATWSTLYGEELELNQIYWDEGQPDAPTAFPNCAAWWTTSPTTVHDCWCDHEYGRIAICDMNAQWRD